MGDITARPSVATVDATLSLRQWLGLAVLLTGIFVTVLDNSIVFLAIPTMRLDLGADFAQAEFVIAVYSLTFAMGLITSGRLGDRYGRRRLFLIGFGAFTCASGLCGLANSPQALILYRILQGLAAALLTPQVFAILRVTFPDMRQRQTALASMGVVIGFASIMGQILGGLIIGADIWGLSWRPVFLVNLPVGLCVLVVTPHVIAESRLPDFRRLDVVGACLCTAALGLLLYPLVEGREAGWPAWSFAMLGASAVSFVIFGIHQHVKTRKNASPLLNTDLFRIKAFTVGLGLVLLFYGTLGPFFLCFTYLVQIGYGLPPSAAALYFSPLAAAFAATSIVAGHLSKTDARKLLMAGAAIVVAGGASAFAVCTLLPGVAPRHLVPSMIIIGAGQGLFMTPVVNVVLSGIDANHAGAAAGVLTTMQRAGNALGVAALQIPFFATLAAAKAHGASQITGYVSAFASVSACVSLMAAIVIWLLRQLPTPGTAQAT
jgi:EmrB/QacA subfamily drug resistance transporter